MIAEHQVPPLDLGRVTCTPAAMQLLEQHAGRHGLAADLVLAHLVSKHAGHDWGTIDAEDAKANTRALIDGGRILGVHDLDGQKLWIITEAEGDDGRRAVTTLLLPEDY
jgi:hypothetical protein